MLDVIPQVNLQDFTSNGSQRQKTFVQTIGDALAEIGFFVLATCWASLKQADKTF